MPYFYDLNRQTTTNGTANTASIHLFGSTVSNQETVGIYGVYAASRFLTAGGGQLNVEDNTGTAATGGTTQAPRPKNIRGNPVAQSAWKTDASAITTTGVILTIRETVGFAQTGGMGGYVPIVPTAAVQMMPGTTNPVDLEFYSDMASASVTIGITVELGEGI